MPLCRADASPLLNASFYFVLFFPLYSVYQFLSTVVFFSFSSLLHSDRILFKVCAVFFSLLFLISIPCIIRYTIVTHVFLYFVRFVSTPAWAVKPAVLINEMK